MKKFSVIIFFCFITNLQAQNQTEMALYNIGLGSVFGGVGAVINKGPDDKLGETFLNGFWKGAIGGYLIYESKNLVGKIPEKERWEYSWAAKMVNSAGTSIVENAASNRGLLEQWHLNIGFNRIEFYTKDQFQVQYKIMPASFFLTVGMLINSTPEWNLMLKTGEVIFSTNPENIPNFKAIALGTTIRVRKNEITNKFVISHEIIHIYQLYDYNFVNPYFNGLKNKLQKNSTAFKSLDKLFYWDINLLTLSVLYQIENLNRNCYYDNFFEYEAEFFAARRRVRCP